MMQDKLTKLTEIISNMQQVTLALSGGMDSMMLAYICHRTLGNNAKMVHAHSAAVPSHDYSRIQKYAKQYSWNLSILAMHPSDYSERYQQNPSNRCYYCKSSLYQALTAINFGQVISGTNLDDLNDYRPGLLAAEEAHIRHPFVEANISKQDIRNIATFYQLEELATLPASPCLASRVETGIFIQPLQLSLIDSIERFVRSQLKTVGNVRCRIHAKGISIEIDKTTLNEMAETIQNSILTEAEKLAKHAGLTASINLRPYCQGSAFIKS